MLTVLLFMIATLFLVAILLGLVFALIALVLLVVDWLRGW